MISAYPYLSTQTVTMIYRFGDYHSFEMGLNYTCSVQFTNYTYKVNKPINGSPEYFLYNNSLYFSDYTTLVQVTSYASDSKYIAIMNDAKSKVSEISTASVVSVYINNLNIGKAYYVSLQKGYDYYYIDGLYTLQNTTFIIRIQKNSDYLYTENYNYNSDASFFTWYINSLNVSKVLNVPSINNVTIKYTSNMKYFKVIFSPLEFME